MRQREVDKFKKLLEERIVALYRAAHREVRARMEGTEDQDQPRDDGDESQRTQTIDLGFHLAANEAAMAQQMEAALARIREGAFGTCIDCGKDIELGRLRAVPWAVRCAEDQEASEFSGSDRSPSL